MKIKNAKPLVGVYNLSLLNDKGKERGSRKEKGSVTVFTVVSCMFMLVVILMVTMGIINKITNQEKEIAQITKNYNATENELEQAYLEATDGEDKYVTFKEVEGLVNTAKEEAKNEAKKEVKNEIYPVGSIYISTNSTNPSQIIGGTWQAYGEGRTLVGVGTGTDSNNTSQTFSNGGTGGEYNHQLTANQLPKLRGGVSIGLGDPIEKGGTGWGVFRNRSGIFTVNGLMKYTYNPGTTYTYPGGSGGYGELDIEFGNNEFHNNVQPYIVTYIWKRTA